MTNKGHKTTSEYSDLLAKLQDIPTLPIVALKVTELINDPSTSSADIAEVLKKDQVLTAKILKLINSSYYAIPGGVADVQRALAFLGFNTLAQLVLSLSVFSLFTPDGTDDFSMLQFWKHALATAVGAELLAKRFKLPRPEEAFTCGLLHDIGKLVLYQIDKERLLTIVGETTANKKSFLEVEKKFELPGHSYLGETIATKWGLPQVIRLTIRYHHLDVSKMDSVLSAAKPVIQAVRLANTICVKNEIGNSGDHSSGEITDDMLAPFKLTLGEIPALEDIIKMEFEKAGAFLNAYH